MKILLGKKLKLVIFGLLLVIAIGFLASRTSNVSYVTGGILSTGNLSDKMHTKALRSVTKKDSDKDGLKDWEEELWRTDPHKKDTDGDGTDDGEEVNLGRNPNIAGPDDVFQEDVFVRQKSQDVSDNLTETEKFSQEFFKEYLSLKQSGASFKDKAAQNALIGSALTKAQIRTESDFYTSADINIIDDSSKEAVKAYGNAMGGIITKHSIENENEAIIIKRALETNNQEELKKLDPIIAVYKNIVNDSLNVFVPQNMADIHLALINSFSEITDTIEGMRIVFSDPLTALNKIASYQENVDRLFMAFQDINEFFRIQDIVFGENEDGHIFTHILP